MTSEDGAIWITHLYLPSMMNGDHNILILCKDINIIELVYIMKLSIHVKVWETESSFIQKHIIILESYIHANNQPNGNCLFMNLYRRDYIDQYHCQSWLKAHSSLIVKQYHDRAQSLLNVLKVNVNACIER